ncbi:MAG: TRAP transporter substrate-binding protein, partial [Rhizobiaceae bacterium]|nr:TRAP transporter substrate-binding protein [Rhizobiaceae bacterium]
FSGKDPALSLLGNLVGAWSSPYDLYRFIEYGGGAELYNELENPYGVQFIGAVTPGLEAFVSTKVLNGVDDLKGLKMRIPGLGGDVMAKLGASPISVPGGQIYENLVSGAIDATEWVGPYNDYFMKFYEAAKYYYWPGMHEPGSQLAMGINASWWGTLSKNEQAIIEAACNEENARTMAETNANNGEYLSKLINDHGVKLREFNDDIYDAFGEAAKEVIEEAREHSDLSKRIYDSVLKARTDIGGWTALSDTAYTLQRNRVING